MRSILLAVTLVLFGFVMAIDANAQQGTQQQKKSGAKCTRTFDQCLQTGIKRGNSPSEATQWCGRNNNGCPQ